MKKVLVVDDSKTIRTICEWIYKETPGVLLTASGLAEAKKIFEAESPSAVIIDYTLPDGNGYAWYEELLRRRVPAMMLVGNSGDSSHIPSSVKQISKPFMSEEFLKSVENLWDLADEMLADTGYSSPDNISAGNFMINDVMVDASNVQKRFNFPISGLTGSKAGYSNDIPQISSPSTSPVVPPSPVATPSAQMRPVSRTADTATPQNPSPAVSPFSGHDTTSSGVRSTASGIRMPPSERYEIDPALLRAEIQSAVREILPGVVRGVLKKLIVNEVTPQIQHWVDARVEALVQNMLKR